MTDTSDKTTGGGYKAERRSNPYAHLHGLLSTAKMVQGALDNINAMAPITIPTLESPSVVTSVVNTAATLNSIMDAFNLKWGAFLKKYEIICLFVETELRSRAPDTEVITIMQVSWDYVQTRKAKAVPAKLSKAEQNRIRRFISELNPDTLNRPTDETDDFFHILQGNALNTLTKIRATESRPKQLSLLDTATIDVDPTFRLIINKYKQLPNGIIPRYVYKFLDCIVIKYTSSGKKDPRVRLPLSEFMEMRGLTDEKTARGQIHKCIDIIKKIEYEAKEKVNGTWRHSGTISIFGGTGYIKNSIIYFTLNPDFEETLQHCSVMEYARETLRIDDKHYPNTYCFSRYLDENYAINQGRDRVVTIGIPALLDRADALPSYETVMASDRAVYRRIIEPVIRDLDIIDRLYYDLVDKDGNRIEDARQLSYDDFIACKIRVDYSDYPDHSQRIAGRVKYAAKIKKNRGGNGQQKGG